jgi:hypothetical protein
MNFCPGQSFRHGTVLLRIKRNRLECRVIDARDLRFRLKLNTRDRKCISNFVEFDTSDSVNTIRRDPLLRKLRCQRHREAASVSRSNQFFRLSC